MRTTLNKIREHEPCTDGWEKLLTYLGKTKADDEEISILTILDSNGLNDAIWCLRAVEGRDKEIRLFAVWCARQVQNLMTDQRSLDSLDVAERYANGEATEKEMDAAWDAAQAAWDAAEAAVEAAVEAARAAEAAVAAEGAAAWDARAAAWDAARAARDARSAAWAAAGAAARSAAWAAAWEAARAAAWDAARAARAKQEAELRRICEEGEVGHEATKTYYQKV